MFPKYPGVPGSGKAYPVLKLRKPDVVFQPKTYHNLQKGVNLIVDAIKPTLGPIPRLVVLEKITKGQSPEFLDDGATIARRIIQIKPREADVGAMLIRHALWKMHEEIGDGTATAAVLFQAIFNEGVRHVIEMGCNAMLLRKGLERGLQTVLTELRKGAKPLVGRKAITGVALGMVQGDKELAELLGEIFDIVGPEGYISVEGWQRRMLEREYIEGVYWQLSGWFSSMMETDAVYKRTIMEDAAILISDLNIKGPEDLIPVLEKAVKGGIKNLVLVVGNLPDSCIGLLVNNNKANTIQTFAVRTPRVAEMDRVASMEDISILTGGKVFYSAANDSLAKFNLEDLGYARRAWGTDSLFGIFGGKGNPRLIRQHMNVLRTKLNQEKDERIRDDLQKRIGRLLGGTAILRVGANTETEKETRKLLAERAVMGLRHTLKGGVVLGGGIGLLNCQNALNSLPKSTEEEKYAYDILARGLEEPLRVIAQNAGINADVAIERVRNSPAGYGLDALSGQIVDMEKAGIYDSLKVLERALEAAVSGASMTLTTDVLVLHKKPVEVVEP
jgi:chaperonin GroEL